MQLLLRKGPNPSSTWYEKLGAYTIMGRLVTDYPHAGIELNGILYHADAKHGLHDVPLTNGIGTWLKIDLGADNDDKLIQLYNSRKGAKYDWLSLFAFTPLNWIANKLGKTDIRYAKWIYCFEWCHEAITGEIPKGKVTPESLLVLSLSKREIK
jgi:hypothetical protein